MWSSTCGLTSPPPSHSSSGATNRQRHLRYLPATPTLTSFLRVSTSNPITVRCMCQLCASQTAMDHSIEQSSGLRPFDLAVEREPPWLLQSSNEGRRAAVTAQPSGSLCAPTVCRSIGRRTSCSPERRRERGG